MEELFSLKTITSIGDNYELKIVIPKNLMPYFHDVFDNFKIMAGDIRHKIRLAEQRSEERREIHRQEVEKRDNAILDQIRTAYALEFNKTSIMRQALKRINRDFKQWVWIRQRFKKEVEAQRDLEIIRLSNQGLNSKQIATKIGLHPGSVRTIVHKQRRL